MSEYTELARSIVAELIKKSGVREWEDVAAREGIAIAAAEMAASILGEALMALPDYFKTERGTTKTLKSSGGDAAITLASLANGNGTSTGARQSASLDLGAATWDQLYVLEVEFELAATPTAGNVINLYGSWHSATGAAFGNTSGSDAAYTGYSNNIDAAAKHLEFLGAHVCTAQATATVQKAIIGLIRPKGRYFNLVVDNRSGAAFHSSDANCLIRLVPLTESVVD